MLSFKTYTILIYLFSALSYAGEVDQLTNRNQKLDDSLSILDAFVIDKMQKALNQANESSYKCGARDEESKKESRIALFENLYKQFAPEETWLSHKAIFGVAESYANENLNSKFKRTIHFNDSIYSEVKGWDSKILKQNKEMNVIKINGVQIGTDKLGHFFSQGKTEYKSHASDRDKNYKVNRILNSGVESETGNFGLNTTGVFSYADLAANFEGYKFWQRLCGTYPSEDESRKKQMEAHRCTDDAYITCKDNKWQLNQKNKFSFADYVNTAWDEGINCSLYSEKLAKPVFGKMNKTASDYKGNPKQPCPAEPAKCDDIMKSYPDRDVRKYILSPKCRDIINAKNSKTDIPKTFQFEYDYESRDLPKKFDEGSSSESSGPSKTRARQ